MSTIYCVECGDAEHHHNLIRNRIWEDNGKIKKRKISPTCPSCYKKFFPKDLMGDEE